MPNFYKILFFNFLIAGSFITMSSYSWMIMWMGLELNIISFIPLVYSKKSIYTSEAIMKYFMVQTLASSMMIFSFSILESQFYLSYQLSYHPSLILLYSAIMMKLGMAPFHSWFPEVTEGLSWTSNFILLTWQKIAPMSILMMTMTSNLMTMIFIVASSLIGSMMGLNQISLRKILAYSSINHMAWMLMAMMNSIYIWLIYFLIYSISNFNLIYMFNNTKIYFIQQLTSLSMNFWSKTIILINMFSLAGLPPMIGFLPKWMVISWAILNNHFVIPVIIIFSTLMAIFFYMRILFPIFFIKNLNPNINVLKFSNSNIFIIFNYLFSFSLLIINFIF